jgi:hypothetical protein
MTTFGWTTNPPSSPTQASYLTIDSPSVLKIYNPNTNQNGYTSQIWSVATDGGSGYVGSAFKPPLAYDGYFNWDGSKAFADSHTHMAGVPAFWGSSIEALTGAPVSGHFLEWDIFEGSGNSGPGGSLSGGTTKHDWSNPSSPVDDRIGYELLLPMVLGTFMRISGIWLPMDSNGWGIFLAFVNGQFKNNSDTIYNSSSVALAGGLAVGEFSHSDSQHLTIFLDTGENSSSPGGGWPFYIDWVKVYTTGSAPTAKSGTRMSLGVGLGLTMN